MTLEALQPATTWVSSGEFRLLCAQERTEAMTRAEAAGYLVVRVPALGPANRGRLALTLEEAVETALAMRGACPPGVGASADLDNSLSDQLYRARLLGARGFALPLPSLAGIANRAGALDAEDSAVLRWWLRATEQRPLRLYLDAQDRNLGIYEAPTLLGLLLERAQVRSPSSPIPPVASEIVLSAAAMRSGQTPLLAQEAFEEAESDEPSLPTHQEPSSASAELHAAAELQTAAEPVVATPPSPDEADRSDLLEHKPFATAAQAPLEPLQRQREDETSAEGEWLSSVSIEPTPAPPAPELQPSSLLFPDAHRHWPEWQQTLEEAKGPRPLAAVEQLFVSAYVPLADAVARGIAGPDARRTLSVWSQSFARSYTDAFDALRLRGKRPMMVLDVADAALRIGRLHGARSVQLVMVDGLRYDLGLRVEARMRQTLGQQAAMTERLLLWSALPTTTSVQLDLIGRGPDGLKDFEPPSDTPVLVARGRAAATLRRVRTGHRDVLKLDLVESRLGERGESVPERLDALADDVAAALAGALEKLAPRTLALVFGDHGFVLDPLVDGSGPARHGGASPEEVLVPAFAWLIGDMH